MPLDPKELLYYLYPNIVLCPNPDCDRNKFALEI